MEVDDAIELGQRSIYHATFRDAVSGGTVSGEAITHSSAEFSEHGTLHAHGAKQCFALRQCTM